MPTEKEILKVFSDHLKDNDKIRIVSWRGNLHVACMILNSNQNSKSKEWAYKEIMKSADLLDKLNERGINAIR